MYINSYLHYNFMELMPIVRNRLNSEENENESVSNEIKNNLLFILLLNMVIPQRLHCLF